jgi:hypothetical protein
MPERELQIVTPAPHFSRAFKISSSYIDRPRAAEFLLGANINRLSRLDECHHAVMMLLTDASSMAELVSSAEHSLALSFEDAVLHTAFERAIHQLYDLNAARIRSALSLDMNAPPLETERRSATSLYGADADATWHQIAAEQAAYHATDWLLGHAAANTNGKGPLSIREALTEAAAGLVPAPQPELTETYRQWGALVLASMPDPMDCID